MRDLKLNSKVVKQLEEQDICVYLHERVDKLTIALIPQNIADTVMIAKPQTWRKDELKKMISAFNIQDITVITDEIHELIKDDFGPFVTYEMDAVGAYRTKYVKKIIFLIKKQKYKSLIYLLFKERYIVLAKADNKENLSCGLKIIFYEREDADKGKVVPVFTDSFELSSYLLKFDQDEYLKEYKPLLLSYKQIIANIKDDCGLFINPQQKDIKGVNFCFYISSKIISKQKKKGRKI